MALEKGPPTEIATDLIVGIENLISPTLNQGSSYIGFPQDFVANLIHVDHFSAE